MDISYNWLKDLIDLDLSAVEVADKLTRVGLTVEGVRKVGDDAVLDIDLTSNRPDCLSHLGIARELAVITSREVTLEKRRDANREPDAPFPAVLAADIVRIDSADLCPRFTARVIRNIKVGPSPEWLVKRLEALGERSINNVADITNYVMLELGQPMHAFDLDKLTENRIVVREARSGEKITTLDGAERELGPAMLAICDAAMPVAVAGIMGGLDTSITDETINVLLEVAYFDRLSIRATSRKLGLHTEASYRFERGVDIENLVPGSDRAAALIVQVAGGAAEQFVDIYPNPLPLVHVSAPDISASTNRLTGMSVDAAGCDRILSDLGISGAADGVYRVPTWRHDISIEEDLVEEVARHTGFENIEAKLPPAFSAGEYQAGETRKRVLRQMLVGQGFDEAISYSFIDEKFDESFVPVPGLLDDGAMEKFVTLRDSVIEGAVRMRPTLLPGLFDAVRLNLNHQRRDIKLFELGKVFATGRSEAGLPTEREVLAMVVTGGEANEDRAIPARDLDYYDAKGALESALAAISSRPVMFEAEDVIHLRRGQSSAVSLGSQKVGYLGRVSEELAADYKFKQPVYVAEIDLQAAIGQEISTPVYRPISKYPSVIRDVSFLIDRKTTFGAICAAVNAAGVELCKGVHFVDVFEGKGMGENDRSLTIRFEYRSSERTLIDDEVNASHQELLRNLENALGIQPRF